MTLPKAEPTEPVKVSVVLPARDAAGSLRRQLDALDRQTFSDAFLVVVADNASTDATAHVAATYRPATYRLRVIRESNVGINFARNAGIVSAPDGKVFLCDADDEVAENWLEGMASALEPGLWVAGALDYCRLNTARTRHVWNAPARSVHHRSDPYVDDTRGCNCGFFRTMWAELGGFDDRLSGTGGDETEFFMRGVPRRVSPTSRRRPAVVGYRLRPGVGRHGASALPAGSQSDQDEPAAGRPTSSVPAHVALWHRGSAQGLGGGPPGPVPARSSLRVGRVGEPPERTARRPLPDIDRRSPAMKFSVVTPAYNASSTILTTIRSVVDQSHPDWELLVVDDGSLDDTAGARRLDP